ncbi:TPA: DNA-directed RNA polymerase subunit F [Candidatus Micrarchaeota archaeon]|nr:DNA-directed RNA polymerase subunit F [Candidatus Micrarchaeota archaeon]
MKNVSEKILLNAEAAELLEKRKKESELGYEQQNALQHLQAFAPLTAKEGRKLFKELAEAGLTEKQAVMVCNLKPEKEDQVKTILTADKSEVTEDKVKEVLKIVKKY